MLICMAHSWTSCWDCRVAETRNRVCMAGCAWSPSSQSLKQRGAGQVIYMTGWAPAASQPSALRRGSATVKLEDLAEMQRQRDRAASRARGDGGGAGA